MRAKFPNLDLVLIESGGDNLAATFRRSWPISRSMSSTSRPVTRFRRKGGPGITRSDLLVINKIDLAPHVRASLEKMDTDARGCAVSAVRHDQPEEERRLDRIIGFIERKGGLTLGAARLTQTVSLTFFTSLALAGPVPADNPAVESEPNRSGRLATSGSD